MGGRRRRRERTTGAGEHRVSAVGGQRGRAAWAPLRSPSPPPRWGCPFCGLLLRWGGWGGEGTKRSGGEGAKRARSSVQVDRMRYLNGFSQKFWGRS